MKITPIPPAPSTLERLERSPIGVRELWTPEGFTIARSPVSLSQFDPSIFAVELPHTHRCADGSTDYVYDLNVPMDQVEDAEIPDELEHLRGVFGVAFGAELAINPLAVAYVGSIRVKQKYEEEGTAMNEATHIHFDMFRQPLQPKSRQAIVVGPGDDTTGVCSQSFDISRAPRVHNNSSAEIDAFAEAVFPLQVDPTKIVRPKAGELVMVDTLTPHFAPISLVRHLRTFVRVTFSVKK